MFMTTAITDSLFDLLDLNHDGSVSRAELHAAAARLGWHWREAPILALLDLLTIHDPIPLKKFTTVMQQIQNDPMGPYGKVLLNSPHFSKTPLPGVDQLSPRGPASTGTFPNDKPGRYQNGECEIDLISAIEKTAGKNVATDYRSLRNTFDTYPISAGAAALLIIDPQRSFTEGVWMQSIGEGAAIDVKPISIAFKNCCDILKALYGRMEIMFSRCPFPPGSFDWDDRLAAIIDSRQLYFIKPGNSILFPPFNGFREWLTRCIGRGIRTLVIGGCTLNSCVRVSAIDIQQMFKSNHLQVVVDLSLCGARLRNYKPSPSYKGISAVAAAVNQMTAAGVQVVRRVEFTS
jgi:hypothetical protein